MRRAARIVRRGATAVSHHRVPHRARARAPSSASPESSPAPIRLPMKKILISSSCSAMPSQRALLEVCGAQPQLAASGQDANWPPIVDYGCATATGEGAPAVLFRRGTGFGNVALRASGGGVAAWTRGRRWPTAKPRSFCIRPDAAIARGRALVRCMRCHSGRARTVQERLRTASRRDFLAAQGCDGARGKRARARRPAVGNLCLG